MVRNSMAGKFILIFLKTALVVTEGNQLANLELLVSQALFLLEMSHFQQMKT
jgi:hypothetical protein